jgi:hypothetical protein
VSQQVGFATRLPLNDSGLPEHLNERVKEIVLDLSAVDYVLGDGLVVAVISLWKSGVRKIRFVASAQNQEPLQNLVKALNLDLMGFSVEKEESSFSPPTSPGP